jgi:hypothetical protein
VDITMTDFGKKVLNSAHLAIPATTDGNDTISVYSSDFPGGVLDGKLGEDTLNLIGPSTGYSASFHFDELSSFGGFETIIGSSLSDTLHF